MSIKEIIQKADDAMVKSYTVKPEKMGDLCETSKGEEYYPSIYLNSDTLPDLKDWKVGEDYYLTVKVTQKSKSMRTEKGKEVWSTDLDIKEIALIDEIKEHSEKSEKGELSEKYAR